MSLIGQRSKRRYRIGDEVTVICKSASKEESFIDFEISSESSEENEGETKEEEKTKKVG